MAVESIFTDQYPVSTNNLDGDNVYDLGTVGTNAVPGTIGGLRWPFPDELPGIPVVGSLYRWISNTSGTLLAQKTFTGGIAGQWNTVLFDTPVEVDADDVWVAVVTTDRYVITGSVFDDGPIVNGNLTAVADTSEMHNGKLNAWPGGGGPAYPQSSFGSACYFVDVLFEASSAEIVGSAVVNLGALTATATGRRRVKGSAVAALGALSAAATGRRRVIGTATASLGAVTAAAAGRRRVNGTAAVNLGGLTALAVAAGASPPQTPTLTATLGAPNLTASLTATTVLTATI